MSDEDRAGDPDVGLTRRETLRRFGLGGAGLLGAGLVGSAVGSQSAGAGEPSTRRNAPSASLAGGSSAVTVE